MLRCSSKAQQLNDLIWVGPGEQSPGVIQRFFRSALLKGGTLWRFLIPRGTIAGLQVQWQPLSFHRFDVQRGPWTFHRSPGCRAWSVVVARPFVVCRGWFPIPAGLVVAGLRISVDALLRFGATAAVAVRFPVGLRFVQRHLVEIAPPGLLLLTRLLQFDVFQFRLFGLELFALGCLELAGSSFRRLAGAQLVLDRHHVEAVTLPLRASPGIHC